MDLATRPWRSVLYIPASRERALDKARTLPTDAIIFDLEDAVAPDQKIPARQILKDALSGGGYGNRYGLVRINDLGSDWGEGDVASLASAGPQALLLPKVNSAADVAALDRLMSGYPEYENTAIWAMMETPLGILNALEIAQAPRMAGFVLGTNDLAKDLGSRARADRLPLIFGLQQALTAARAAGIICVDGVFNAFKDEDGLRAECQQGLELGMDGKTLIHPAQLPIANEVFRPKEAEIELAERQIAAFDAAIAAGEAVAVVDGKIVENLHVDTARSLLARAKAITALEG